MPIGVWKGAIMVSIQTRSIRCIQACSMRERVGGGCLFMFKEGHACETYSSNKCRVKRDTSKTSVITQVWKTEGLDNHLLCFNIDCLVVLGHWRCLGCRRSWWSIARKLQQSLSTPARPYTAWRHLSWHCDEKKVGRIAFAGSRANSRQAWGRDHSLLALFA